MYNYISDNKDYVDPFNPPELDVNDAFNEYNNNYDENNQQNNRDYSNNYEDGNNDNVDYSSDYNGAPAETDNFPDYGPQQTIEANTRVEQNNNKQVRIPCIGIISLHISVTLLVRINEFDSTQFLYFQCSGYLFHGTSVPWWWITRMY